MRFFYSKYEIFSIFKLNCLKLDFFVDRITDWQGKEKIIIEQNLKLIIFIECTRLNIHKTNTVYAPLYHDKIVSQK